MFLILLGSGLLVRILRMIQTHRANLRLNVRVGTIHVERQNGHLVPQEIELLRERLLPVIEGTQPDFVLLQTIQLVLRELQRLVQSHLHNDGGLWMSTRRDDYAELHIAFILRRNHRIHKEKRSHIKHVLDLLFLILHMSHIHFERTLF